MPPNCGFWEIISKSSRHLQAQALIDLLICCAIAGVKMFSLFFISKSVRGTIVTDKFSFPTTLIRYIAHLSLRIIQQPNYLHSHLIRSLTLIVSNDIFRQFFIKVCRSVSLYLFHMNVCTCVYVSIRFN